MHCGGPREFTGADRLAAPLVVDGTHCGVASRIELQGSGRACLKYGEAYRNGGEKSRFPPAVLGDEERCVVLGTKSYFIEATVVCGAYLP